MPSIHKYFPPTPSAWISFFICCQFTVIIKTKLYTHAYKFRCQKSDLYQFYYIGDDDGTDAIAPFINLPGHNFWLIE